jgi:phenylpyruvate tautomerase PptA (4-oxalocrotonate tautomerase family)
VALLTCFVDPPAHRREEISVPLIRVELFDFRMSDETSEKLISGMTDALCAATHEGLRDHTWVIVEGHSPKNWGLGGKPWPVEQMPGVVPYQ